MPDTAGATSHILYLQRGAVVYRLFSTHIAGTPERDALARVASTLHVPVPRDSLPTSYTVAGWLHSPQNASSARAAKARPIVDGRAHPTRQAG